MSDPQYILAACCIGAVLVYALIFAGVYIAGENYKRMDKMVEERKRKHENDKV